MSLAGQSQQWYPTSVQVTVHQARSLRVKGKNGTNDAYAIIQVAKDKFSTSVAEKCVAPVWKEEASFDLPLFHPGNAERCTLCVIVMHRAHAGLDKFLGQAVVNLLSLHDNKSRKKTDWYKLVDKTGKEDKARGEVLLDIHFMRNNMSASMFDLSMQDKPRSRISKLKDKVRGKKKDSFSDSASAIVPSVSQVLTDSEGEADSVSLNQIPGEKKKSKFKNLFAPKSNLQRNTSQSMSTLGTLQEKNSSLSGSRSSGLNIDTPEVKKKFKFLGHKRTGSSDSKVSQGPFSLLGRNKQSNSDLNNLCINGNHVYAEETEPKSGSTLSLNSSGQGSVEDIQKHTSDFSADPFKSVPVTSRHESTDMVITEQQHHQEDEEGKQAEARRIAEAKRLEEEEKYKAEAKRLQEKDERRHKEEQEMKRRFLEEDARRRKQKAEEEDRRKQEVELRKLEAAENEKLEEEHRRAEQQRQDEQAQKVEEQKRQEEASMTERLSSLFGMIRKKDEKKEEAPQHTKEELPTQARDPDMPISHSSTNPFVDISLNSDIPARSNESPADHQKSSHNPTSPSAMVFLNRAAKVSAVKPRLAHSVTSENTYCQTPSQQCPSPASPESTLSSVPSESPDSFSNLHSSLAPSNISQSLSGSPCISIEDLSSVGSSPTMSDKRRRAPQPPFYHVHEPQTRGHHVPVREITNPGYVEADGSQQGQKSPMPLPDYETLFPQKRHGVQGHTRWDHIIAEVNQKHRDTPELVGSEMSVDAPEERGPRPRSSLPQESSRSSLPQESSRSAFRQESSRSSLPQESSRSALPQESSRSAFRQESSRSSLPQESSRSSLPQESSAMRHFQTQRQESKPVSSKKVAAPPPPKPVVSPHLVESSSQRQSQNMAQADQSLRRPIPSAVQKPLNTNMSSISINEARKVFEPSLAETHAPRPSSQTDWDSASPVSQRTRKAQVSTDKEEPIANPRLIGSGKEPVQDRYSAVQTSSSSRMSNFNKRSAKENIEEWDPFPKMELLSKDPWAQPNPSQETDDLFTRRTQKEQKPEDLGMTADDLDNIFSQENLSDPFAGFNDNETIEQADYGKKEDESKHISPAFQRNNSQRRKPIIPSITQSEKASRSRQEPAYDEETAITAANHVHPARDVMNETVTPNREADENTQIDFHGREDPFVAEPFTVPSSLTSSDSLQAILEEPASQAGVLSGGKPSLRAWVSPSEVQPVTTQNSNGGGLALTPRRPHPVKPMNSGENQHSISSPAVKDIKVHNRAPATTKFSDSMRSGPYTQLTQEELITLVVKQQVELSKKDAKIVELEEYIDNLLVRVIEEQPTLLHALNSAKPV